MSYITLSGRQDLLHAALLTVVCIALCGCVRREALPPEAQGKVIVVATIFPLADWAREIGGDRVFVETLLPANASPHTFDPAPREMRLVAHSSLFLKAGLHMDDWGSSLVKSAGKDGPFVLSVGEILSNAAKIPDVCHLDVDVETLGVENTHNNHDHDHGNHNHGHKHGNINPHFWLDPQLAIESVAIIRNALAKIDPEGRDTYEANAANYLEKLKALDTELAEDLRPHSGKGFVSFHNAWPYLANRYNLRIVAVIEEYAGKTPSENYLRTVTDRLKKLEIQTIFSEPQLNSRVADLIASEIGGTVSLLDPYGTEGTPERGSYITTMKYNSNQLVQALSATHSAR